MLSVSAPRAAAIPCAPNAVVKPAEYSGATTRRDGDGATAAGSLRSIRAGPGLVAYRWGVDGWAGCAHDLVHLLGVPVEDAFAGSKVRLGRCGLRQGQNIALLQVPEPAAQPVEALFFLFQLA